MFDTLRMKLVGLAAALSLGTCGGCVGAPYVPGSKTVEAVQQECGNRPVDQTVYCYAGVYDGLQFALAEERAAGTLSPEVEAWIDQSIQFLAPRVVTVKESYGKVAKLQAEVDALKPLAEQCVALASGAKDAEEGAVTRCLTEIGFLAVSGKLSDAVAEASADWAELEPQLRDFISLGKKETE